MSTNSNNNNNNNSNNGVMQRQETFSEKATRKFTKEPLVPIGILVTAGFLLSGFKAFRDGKQVRAQQMMRGRVVAQFATICVIVMGAYFGFKPHDRPATYEEKLKILQSNSNNNNNDGK